jgi:ElaB/YqjD/DUF883 family membrane-anchored ribosome-binding protein
VTEATETGPAAAEDGHPGTAAGQDDPTVHELAGKVDRLTSMVEQLLGGGKEEPAAEAPDIKAEVRAAVREVQAKEKKKADDEAEAQSIQDRIGHLEKRAETPPADHEAKRSSRMMGWARP